jgi:hypothetical protein
MFGREFIITHGDPEKIEVNAFQEVSFSIVDIDIFGLSLYSEY